VGKRVVLGEGKHLRKGHKNAICVDPK
jgi:hypothetical protein